MNNQHMWWFTKCGRCNRTSMQLEGRSFIFWVASYSMILWCRLRPVHALSNVAFSCWKSKYLLEQLSPTSLDVSFLILNTGIIYNPFYVCGIASGVSRTWISDIPRLHACLWSATLPFNPEMQNFRKHVRRYGNLEFVTLVMSQPLTSAALLKAYFAICSPDDKIG